MVGVLHCGLSSPGLNPGRGHYVLFLGKTLYSHSAFPHPGIQMWNGDFNVGVQSCDALLSHPGGVDMKKYSQLLYAAEN